MEWLDELTLIAETTAENRVNKNGFAVKPEESTRTVFCNKKSVGYSEYFKSQQTGKLVNADDEEKERREMYRVTLFHKGDFEAQLDKTKEVLKAAGVYINSIDAESYETETGYWLVPITVEILKEE